MAEGRASPNEQHMIRLRRILTCPVCNESYTAQERLPKALPCIHNMCASCLYRYMMTPRPSGEDPGRRPGGGFCCPQCQAPFRMPLSGIRGLPTNNTLLSMLDMLVPPGDDEELEEQTQREPANVEGVTIHSPQCDDHGHDCTLYCVECELSLCIKCLLVSSARHTDHTIKEIQKEPVNVEDHTVLSQTCDDHGHDCTLYCQECETPLCIKCIIVSSARHTGHTLEELKTLHQSFNTLFEQTLTAYQNLVDEYDSFVAETSILLEHHQDALTEEMEETIENQIQELKLQCTEDQHVFEGNVSVLLRDFDKFTTEFHQQKMDISNAIFQVKPTTCSRQNNELLTEINSRLKLMESTLQGAKEAKLTISTLTKLEPNVTMASGSVSKLVEISSTGTQTEDTDERPQEQEPEQTPCPANVGSSEPLLLIGLVSPTTVNMYLDLNDISPFLKRANSSVYSQPWIINDTPWKLEADFNRQKLGRQKKGQTVLWAGAVCEKRGRWRHNASYILKLYDFSLGQFVQHDSDERHTYTHEANDWGCEVFTKTEITDPENPYVRDNRLRLLMTLTVHS